MDKMSQIYRVEHKVFTSVDYEHGFIQKVHKETAEAYEAHRLETIAGKS